MKSKRNKGFTLIELIVVIAIIAILAAVVVPNLFGLTEKAKEASTKALASAVVSGAQGYWAQQVGGGHMIFPSSRCTEADLDPVSLGEDLGDGGLDDAGVVTENARRTGINDVPSIVASLDTEPEDYTCTDDASVIEADGVGEATAVWRLTNDFSYVVVYSRGADPEEFKVSYYYNADGDETELKAGGTAGITFSVK